MLAGPVERRWPGRVRCLSTTLLLLISSALLHAETTHIENLAAGSLPLCAELLEPLPSDLTPDSEGRFLCRDAFQRLSKLPEWEHTRVFSMCAVSAPGSAENEHF